MALETFRWRGITFTAASEDNFDSWSSGHWKVERAQMQTELGWYLRWTASWSHLSVTWSAYDEERQWDRLAALEALLDKAKNMSLSYYRELGDAWQTVRSLERDLPANRFLQADILQVEKTRAKPQQRDEPPPEAEGEPAKTL